MVPKSLTAQVVLPSLEVCRTAARASSLEVMPLCVVFALLGAQEDEKLTEYNQAERHCDQDHLPLLRRFGGQRWSSQVSLLRLRAVLLPH